jgi:hypothetical protein
MGFERIWVGVDSATIEGGGLFEVILVVGDISGVEEGARVGGVGGEPGVELGCGGFPVGFEDCGFGGGYLIRENAGGRRSRGIGGLLFWSLNCGGLKNGWN